MSSSWKTLLEHFSGDFDNYNQVVEDRKNNLLPREGGGHEHIHCTLVPVVRGSSDGANAAAAAAAADLLSPTRTGCRLAAFYFEGQPERIFRFRHYQLLLEDSSSSYVDMILHTLHPELEAQLRQHSCDPTLWPSIYAEFRPTNNNKLSQLNKCDVRWSTTMDPVLHSYALEHPEAHSPSVDQHHAVMVYGEAIVNSTVVLGTEIRIKDQLSLWQDDFWIHDRGYNVSSGEFIYGNQRNVPYQLRRVTKFEKGGRRSVVNADLEWTLGPDWRTPEEYEQRMAQIGGVSSRWNAPTSATGRSTSTKS